MGETGDRDLRAALGLILGLADDAPAGVSEAQPREAALAGLIALRHLRNRLDAAEPQLIAAARAAGASWAELAPAMGVASRQAAERRYLRVRRSDHDDTTATADQRVTAERDRRAGTRAIADWARTNSADLRRLAGQITALTDLGPRARASLDRLHHALGTAEPAALLPLLLATHQHLRSRHADLADQITAISRDANQVRHATQQRREYHRGADPRRPARTDTET
jgi:hypothetical protein